MSNDKPNCCVTSPRVFFRGHYVFRTLNGTMAVLVPLLVSMFFTYIALEGTEADDKMEELLIICVRTVFLLVALFFGGVGLRAMWGWVCNERILVEINEQGIVSGKRNWPWERIQAFIGTDYNNGVALGFTLSGEGIWFGRDKLPTTPPLTEQQYVELAHELSDFLSTRFPDVEVAMHPVHSSD